MSITFTRNAVLTEAMAFGKPVICSQGAKAVEMIVNGENGFVFDPGRSSKLAEYMGQFLENPHLIEAMGKKSEEIMIAHTPAKATQSFIQALKFVIN
ncbi:glycosyltransferase [Pleurocapsa sp. FMAR1]|uniref:glycosyltransferase n=1 Tax=Pleurocapsa sp. FMAR1 TaxID=3040204 RepID=UPI0029C5FD00|nr:glycosyltransferase [Pleurocapsa sp. FMAR1]